jgi:hypothetical protein
MAIYFRKLTPGQSRWHVGGNVWPGAINRRDRHCIGTWYLTVHAFGLYLDVCGKTRAARS